MISKGFLGVNKGQTGSFYLFFVPFYGLFKTLLKPEHGNKAEFLFGPGNVQFAPGLAIGFGLVPDNFTFKARNPPYHLHELFNFHFVVRTDINGF